MARTSPKPHLTIEQHARAAARLAAMLAESDAVLEVVCSATNRSLANEALRLRASIRRLRAGLKVMLYREHGYVMARTGMYEPPWNPVAYLAGLRAKEADGAHTEPESRPAADLAVKA